MPGVVETGFLEEGTGSAGVQGQYSGTARRIENRQVGASLALPGREGHAPPDREPYLPKEWGGDAERRGASRVPDGVGLTTRPRSPGRMTERAWKAGAGAARAASDAAHRGGTGPRRSPESNRWRWVPAARSGQRP